MGQVLTQLNKVLDPRDACGGRGLNTQPSDLLSDALPIELSPQIMHQLEIEPLFHHGKVSNEVARIKFHYHWVGNERFAPPMKM